VWQPLRLAAVNAIGKIFSIGIGKLCNI
jgi:hypothetical protein